MTMMMMRQRQRQQRRIPWQLFCYLIMMIATASYTGAQECTADGRCDTHERCPVWREEGECHKTADYMHQYCPASCGTAAVDAILAPNGDDIDNAEMDAADDDDADEENGIEEEGWSEVVAASREFGVEQQVKGEQAAATVAWIEATIVYMRSDLVTNMMAPPPGVEPHCRNRDELCSFWAVIGECDSNPTYMQAHCSPSCRSCHKMAVSGGGSDEGEL
jgi:prolyl 4-hydroxylase